MTYPTVQEIHLAITSALRDLHTGGFDSATRRYAATSWPGHELGAGKPNGTVDVLSALSDAAQPRETRDRWDTHAPTIIDALGPEHPATLATRNNLAFWRGEAGDAAGAAAAFAELLPLRERVLGPEHPDTLATRNNLAHSRGQAGDAAGAAAALTELLPLRERVLGPEHPDTLTTRGNLAFWRGEAGDAAGAAAALTELLPLLEWVFGPEHPDTLATRNYLASRRDRAARKDDGWEASL